MKMSFYVYYRKFSMTFVGLYGRGPSKDIELDYLPNTLGRMQ